MDKVFAAINWIVRKIFFITIVVLLIFYIRWFRLTPWVFFDDPTFAYMFGLILLIVYGIFIKAWFVSKNAILKMFLLLISIGVLVINCLYLEIHIPRLVTTVKCNSIRYYITSYSPFLDEQWQYDQLSKWRGVFYQSTPLRFSGLPSYRIICDEEKKEANLVNTFNDVLYYTDAENPRFYVENVHAKLKGHLYFIAREVSFEGCNKEKRNCAISIYIPYECKLDYTACNPLPIRYTDRGSELLYLQADKTTGDVFLFIKSLGNGDETLIFSYGNVPRCYVDHCSILDQ